MSISCQLTLIWPNFTYWSTRILILFQHAKSRCPLLSKRLIWHEICLRIYVKLIDEIEKWWFDTYINEKINPNMLDGVSSRCHWTEGFRAGSDIRSIEKINLRIGLDWVLWTLKGIILFAQQDKRECWSCFSICSHAHGLWALKSQLTSSIWLRN